VRRLDLQAKIARDRSRAIPIAQIRVGHPSREPHRRLLGRRRAQRQPAVRSGERDRLPRERGFERTHRRVGHRRQHVFGQPHEVLVVDVGLVELEHREFGIVLRRDPLVPEVAVDLVDAFEPTHRQPLEIQLGRDAQIQLEIERVVMRDKRPGQRAAGHRLHHRRLDFQEAARVEKRADGRHHARAGLKHGARVGIDDQIQIALPVSRFNVAQAVPFLRQRQQALGQEVQARGPNRQLVRLGPEQPSFHADHVAQVQLLVDLKIQRGHGVRANVDLQPGPTVRQDDEIRLAKRAHAKNPAGDANRDLLGLQRLTGLGVMRGAHVGNRRRSIKPIGIGRDAERLNRLEFGLSLRDLFGFVGH
jgi:hypothetical protein